MFFDAHTDIWTDLVNWPLAKSVFRLRSFHIPRMKQAGMKGGIFVIWIDPTHYATGIQRAYTVLKHINTGLAACPDLMAVCHSYKEYAKAVDQNKLGVIIGMEGFGALDGSVDALYDLYARGVRHASLTWNEDNAFASGVRGDKNKGLSAAGKEAVTVMEHLGMLVDVSHANDKTFWDICEYSRKPFLASHSNCRTLCKNPRNMSDEQIRVLGERNGLLGINAYGAFIANQASQRNMDQYINHVLHAAALGGIENVGFGFDFGDYLAEETLALFIESDNYSTKELENVGQVPQLLKRMRERGFSPEEIVQVAWGNMHRLLSSILL